MIKMANEGIPERLLTFIFFFFLMPKYNTLTQYLLGEQHEGPRWSTRQNQTPSTQGNPSCWRFSAVYFEGRGASACLASALGEVSVHRRGGFSWAIGREKLWVSSSVGLVAQKSNRRGGLWKSQTFIKATKAELAHSGFRPFPADHHNHPDHF